MAELADLNVIIASDTTMVVERFYFGEDFGNQPQQLAE